MTTRHKNLHEYLAATGVKKWFLAKQLSTSRFQLAGLLYPDRYPVVLTEELVSKIATLLNQPPDYVRKLYARAA